MMIAGKETHESQVDGEGPNRRPGVFLTAGLVSQWGVLLSPAGGAVLMIFPGTVIIAFNARSLRLPDRPPATDLTTAKNRL